jgi:putative ABC transport system permease protein
LAKTYEELLDLFVEVIGVSRYVAVMLAFLVALNTTSINVDERRRDLATMFVFGTPVGTTIRMAVIENLLVGILSTMLGLGLGRALLNWILTAHMETMVPEIGILGHVTPTRLVLVASLGIGLVALTPVLTVRKLVQMDIPSTLRVVESISGGK